MTGACEIFSSVRVNTLVTLISKFFFVPPPMQRFSIFTSHQGNTHTHTHAYTRNFLSLQLTDQEHHIEMKQSLGGAQVNLCNLVHDIAFICTDTHTCTLNQQPGTIMLCHTLLLVCLGSVYFSPAATTAPLDSKPPRTIVHIRRKVQKFHLVYAEVQCVCVFKVYVSLE